MSNALTKSDIKTLSLSSLGGALEFYDFIVFLTFIPILKLHFFPEQSELGSLMSIYGIYAVAYFVRPLSGIILAHFGDIVGRKRMFMLSLFLMAVPTLMIGLLPTYESVGILAPILLLFMRLLQGIALGGEVPSAHVFVTEHVKSNHLGLANSLIAAGLTFGVLIGYAISTSLNIIFTEQEVKEFAWRIPFIIGGGLGLFALYLRRYLQETPVFLQFKAEREKSSEFPIKTVLKKYLKESFFGILTTWLLMTGVIMVLLIPNLMKSELYGLSAPFVNKIALLATAMNIIGSVIAGLMVDRIGLSKTMIFFSIILGTSSTIFFSYLGTDSNTLLIGGLYIFSSLFLGLVACVPIFIVKLYEPQVRLTGMSFSYNIGNAFFGGLTTFLVPVIAQGFSENIVSYYLIFLCALGIYLGFVAKRFKI
ncbi:MFS transporter [Wohlfahrtiimonas larvae]|uniref:MFS transporter n=1 Tax=Wohlfahrtiimonas larvae TaxID=1157986 RepID=A0ABP9MV49_9GAMM|nr:MFS transporter [Wohlfahrtiimonas larvae]